MLKAINKTIDCSLSFIGEWIGLLAIRLLLAWEFGWAGIGKLNGTNWFDNVVDQFPFPFNVVPPELSWFVATWTEIIGAIALVLGFFTRFWAAGLIILDAVAWFSVHADNGYNVCSNGYKLPLLFMVMLLPLLFLGPGKLSLDYLFSGRSQKGH